MQFPGIISEKKKLFVIVFGIMAAIIIFMVIKNLVFTTEENEEVNLPTFLKESSIKIERVDIKKLDVEVFASDKYQDLKDNKIKPPSIDELNKEKGKINPFKPE